jgi:hypothetical protein
MIALAVPLGNPSGTGEAPGEHNLRSGHYGRGVGRGIEIISWQSGSDRFGAVAGSVASLFSIDGRRPAGLFSSCPPPTICERR